MKKTLLYAVMVIAAFGASSCAKTQGTAESGDAVEKTAVVTDEAVETTASTETAQGGVVMLSDDNVFRPDTKVQKLTILDFNATWCGPCKMLAPVFDSAAKTFSGKVDFVSIDIDKCTATRDAFGVEAVPTVVIMRPDGKTERYVGTQELLPADNFIRIVKDNL